MRRLFVLALLASPAFAAIAFEPFEQAGEFKLLLPPKAAVQSSRMTLKEGAAITRSWTAQQPAGLFSAATVDYPAGVVAKSPPSRFLLEARDALINQLRLKVLTETKKEISRGESLAFTAASADFKVSARVTFADGRLFTLFVLGEPSEDAEKFINSLELLGPQNTGATAEIPVAAGVTANPGEAPKGKDSFEFRDPAGDDRGPGTYTYPTDPVFKKGSFDLLALRGRVDGSDIVFDLELGATLEDPWKMGVGFSLQHAVVYLDLDGKPDDGHLEGLPGQNISFAKGHGWDKAVVITPQGASRVRSELQAKTGALAVDFVVPARVKGAGRHVEARVPREQLSSAPLSTWRVQVALTGQEGFPAGQSVLVRQVNEYEGAFRFGGGTDSNCDPHVLDLLAGLGTGASQESTAQNKQLAYECNADGTPKKLATLELLKP